MTFESREVRNKSYYKFGVKLGKDLIILIFFSYFTFLIHFHYNFDTILFYSD